LGKGQYRKQEPRTAIGTQLAGARTAALALAARIPGLSLYDILEAANVCGNSAQARDKKKMVDSKAADRLRTRRSRSSDSEFRTVNDTCRLRAMPS
jgi:hypothetical protein